MYTVVIDPEAVFLFHGFLDRLKEAFSDRCEGVTFFAVKEMDMTQR